ncbi:MAG: baseplate J/gp47 family protein [Symbiobacteriaceae bacterium]|nr:baseplate J/gp47 family protein [Symbiobacteriaceae bacterium]
MIPEHLVRTKEQILAEMLERVPRTVDKRIASIIYDTLAPAAEQLASAYISLRDVYRDTYAKTARNEYLELRVGEIGIFREDATPAIREGRFTGADGLPFAIPLASRFSAIGEVQTFATVAQIAAGVYRMQAEQPGAAGNDYLGQLLPITHIPGLQTAELGDILIAGSDAESDDHLLARYIERLRVQPFAGNITAYREFVGSLPGVGGVQVYPVWDGGGTVKCSIIGSDLLPASEYLVAEMQDAVDPEPQGSGTGLAPIDHVVTIQAAQALPVIVKATVTIAAGYELEQLYPLIVTALEDYFVEIRRTWDKPPPRGSLEYISWIFRSRVNSQFFSVPGILNVEELTLNDDELDIRLQQNAIIQEIPLLEEVILDERL